MSIIGYMQTISDVGMILKNRVITHGVDKKICAVALVAASPSVTSSVFYAELQKNFGTVWLPPLRHLVVPALLKPVNVPDEDVGAVAEKGDHLHGDQHFPPRMPHSFCTGR